MKPWGILLLIVIGLLVLSGAAWPQLPVDQSNAGARQASLASVDNVLSGNNPARRRLAAAIEGFELQATPAPESTPGAVNEPPATDGTGWLNWNRPWVKVFTVLACCVAPLLLLVGVFLLVRALRPRPANLGDSKAASPGTPPPATMAGKPPVPTELPLQTSERPGEAVILDLPNPLGEQWTLPDALPVAAMDETIQPSQAGRPLPTEVASQQPESAPPPAPLVADQGFHEAKTVRTPDNDEPEPLQLPDSALLPASDDLASHEVKTTWAPGRWEPEQFQPLESAPPPEPTVDDLAMNGAKTVRAPGRWEPDQSQAPESPPPPALPDDELASHGAKTVRAPGRWEPDQSQAPEMPPPALPDDELASHGAKTVRAPGRWEPDQPQAPESPPPLTLPDDELASHGAKTVRSPGGWEPDQSQAPESPPPLTLPDDELASHGAKTVRSLGGWEPDQSQAPESPLLPAFPDDELASHGAKTVRSPGRWEPEQTQIPESALPPTPVEDGAASYEAKTVRSPSRPESVQPPEPVEQTIPPMGPAPSRPYGANIFDAITPTPVRPPENDVTNPDFAPGPGLDISLQEIQPQASISQGSQPLETGLLDANLDNSVGSVDTGPAEIPETTVEPLKSQPRIPAAPAPDDDLSGETLAPGTVEAPEHSLDAPPIVCQACGQPLRPTSKFCPRCGSKV